MYEKSEVLHDLPVWETEGNEVVQRFTFFDFEANGVDPSIAEPIEFAGAHFENGVMVDSINFLIYQDIEIDPQVVDVTGITTEEMKREGIPEEEAVRKIHDFLGTRLIVAHNIGYDLQILNELYKRHGRKRPIDNHFIDTLTIGRNVDFYPHRLDKLCERHNVPLTGAHRALNDVVGGAGLLLHYAKDNIIRPYVDKLGYFGKYAPPAWYPEYATLVKQWNKYNN
ncbi:3'-5' exonuclease [Paenibacillus pabuli]|uniref:3'-5' exonuclease n=1 Tax=Paenibacillus pabuli TaxID=1472 RepID=UPI003241FB18